MADLTQGQEWRSVLEFSKADVQHFWIYYSLPSAVLEFSKADLHHQSEKLCQFTWFNIAPKFKVIHENNSLVLEIIALPINSLKVGSCPNDDNFVQSVFVLFCVVFK